MNRFEKMITSAPRALLYTLLAIPLLALPGAAGPGSSRPPIGPGLGGGSSSLRTKTPPTKLPNTVPLTAPTLPKAVPSKKPKTHV